MANKGRSYMRVDPGFPGHEKAIKAKGDGIWLWLAMKSYAKRERTNGRIPAVKIGRLDGPPPSRQKMLTKRLLDVGLLEKAGEDYQLHDYLDWEESAEEEEARRESARKRKRVYDQRQREAALLGLNQNATRGPPSNTSSNGVSKVLPDVVTNRVRNALPEALLTSTNQTKPNQTNEEGGPQPDPGTRLWNPPEQREDVQSVMARWREAFGKPGAKLDHRRAECIAERLDAGATIEQVDAAFRGSRLDSWVTSKGFQLALILGDQERFEHLVDLGTGRTKPQPNGRDPVQPNHGVTGWEGAER